MKTSRLFPAAVAAALFALNAAAGPAAPRAEVNYSHPEKFADIKDAFSPTEKGKDAILSQIRDFIVSEAKYYVPEGDKLTLTFTDIDLAGEFEPWRGPQWDQIRVVKDIYPPAFKFSYSVADPGGRVLKEGTENIRDMNFQLRPVIDVNDPLRFEKDILKDWMASTLGGLKKP